MSSRFRSSSVGAVPQKKALARSRAESSQPAPLEVRCACQFFQSDSLIPERINPVGSRPPSRAGEIEKPIYCSKQTIIGSTVKEEELSGSVLSFGKSSVPDYYGETNNAYRVESNDAYNHSQNKENEQLSQINQQHTFDNRSIPSIEIETYTRNYPIMNLGQNTRTINAPSRNMQGQFSSQKSLDRYSTSALLNKYRPKSQSVAPSLQGSSADIRGMSRMTKTVSFDYGKPSNSKPSNENPNFDQYHRMSPMVFPIRDRLQKLERMHDSRDHEYEPIGEPLQADENASDADLQESQKRKIADNEDGATKKFLRTPTEDSEDNISAQDFQNDIESRFFKQATVPTVDNEAFAVRQEITFDEAVVIDEEPVKREVPRKRNFMSNAQERSKNFHKKVKAQAGAFKSSISNKMKKKPKEKPVAVEVSNIQVNDEEASADVHNEPENIETVNVQSAEPKAKTFKMPKFKTMPKFKKPEMPKISMPDRPDFKMGERFSNLRKLGRSKSMKEESVATTDSTSFTTPEVATAEPTKKKFDFGTYPRMIRDKFKRPKLPERSDQSVRSDTPPVVEFTKPTDSFLQRGPVASRWPEYDQDSGKYQQFNSESEFDRESSIERRMRLDYERTTEEREDFEIVKRLMSEEQRQLDEMDRENQEIHLSAKQERYKKPADRQGSDVGSEEDKMLWSGMLNKDTKQDFDEPNALRFDDDFKYSLDQYKNESDINRSYTPQTNQETQSSGSSGTRRRKGELDDEDDYFLRENRVQSHEIHIGDYISSAIKEGLSSPEDNALVQMGHYEEFDADGNRETTPERPIRSLKRKNKKNREEEHNEDEDWNRGNIGNINDFYKTFPPDRPTRQHKKSIGEEEEDEDMGEVDLNKAHQVSAADEYIDDEDDEIFYRQQILRGLEHPDLILDKEDFENDFDYNVSKLPVPPTPPRRRKKKMTRSLQPVVNLRKIAAPEKVPLTVQNVHVYRSQPEFSPLAQEEHFTTPTPTPRRTRSRSQISARTLDDADSFKKDSVEAFTSYNVQDKENGYAQIRKETPSRPVRRKRSTKSLGERQFATMPHYRRDEITPPPRPVRNYSTIQPSKPPRRKSAGSLVEISKTIKIDDDDYEEILDKNQDNVNERLKSGDVVNKMKDRPLPPPPRPKREHKKHKKDEEDDKFDKDDGAEREPEIEVSRVTETATIPAPLTIDTENIHTDHFESLQLPSNHLLPRQDSDFSEPEKVVEVEVSTQTDPVADEDFACDEDDEDIDIDEFLASDGKMKTLEDILKEEQEAEMERARQLAEAENLSRGIQRFRDSNQRSMSERSRTSADRSRSLSRPITPSAVVVEMKKSSPIFFNNEEQTVTQAGLFIHPITYDDYGRQPNEEEPHVSEPVEENIDVNNNFDNELEAEVNEILNAPIVARTIETQTSLEYVELVEDFDDILMPDEDVVAEEITFEEEADEFDAEMQRKIEEMIESVMNSAKEEADWLREEDEKIANAEPEVEFSEEIEPEAEIVEEAEPELKAIQEGKPEAEIIQDEIVMVKAETTEAAPVPPPRRRSTIEEVKTEVDVVDSMPMIDESQIENVEVRETVAQEPESVKETVAVVEQSQDDEISEQFPNRLHLSSLEIDRLSVSSLQAGRIVASEIDSHSIVTDELDCKSSHNISASMEFPPGFIEEIVERVRSAERAEHQASVQVETTQADEPVSQTAVPVSQTAAPQPPPVDTDEPPVRPPLPKQFGHSDIPEYPSTIPPSFYQLRDFSEEETHPQMTQRRKRHQQKRRDSTSEEDYQRDQRSRNRGGPSNDQSVMSLGGQFMRACGNSLGETGGQLMEILRASSKDENKRDLHIALIILIIIIAGLILMGVGEKSVHHHHWDFFNPPDNHGR